MRLMISYRSEGGVPWSRITLDDSNARDRALRDHHSASRRMPAIVCGGIIINHLLSGVVVVEK